MHTLFQETVTLPYSISKNELCEQLDKEGLSSDFMGDRIQLRHPYNSSHETEVTITCSTESFVRDIIVALGRVTTFIHLWERLHAYGKYRAEADCDPGQVAL